MSLRTILSDQEAADVPKEVILNLFRETDKPVLGTNAVAESIEMSTDGARNRLRTLEADGHLVSQKIGTKERATLVWGLHPEERSEPLNPDIARLVRVFDFIRSIGRHVLVTSLVALLVSFGLMFAGISGAILETSFVIMSNERLIAHGWVFAAGAGIVAIFGGAGLYGTVITERVVEWIVTQQTAGTGA